MHVNSPENVRSKVQALVGASIEFHRLNKHAESALGLSLVQYHLLAALRERPGCSPQKLAYVLGLHPSTLTQSLKRLLRKTFIYVSDDPRDSRKKVLGLTREGMSAIHAFETEFSKL